jgi:hypothetical protein
VLEFDLPYALFASDDVRFRPGRLADAKTILDENPDVCIFHFEGYALFGMNRAGMQRVGPMDENFWPAYAEDCDYWFRAQLVGCKMYYRGGYSPEGTNPSLNAFVDHGDLLHPEGRPSSTHLSFPGLAQQVDGTLDSHRGRFAYLVRKWNFNACDYYHEFINAWREEDVVLEPEMDIERNKRTTWVRIKCLFIIARMPVTLKRAVTCKSAYRTPGCTHTTTHICSAIPDDGWRTTGRSPWRFRREQ